MEGGCIAGITILTIYSFFATIAIGILFFLLKRERRKVLRLFIFSSRRSTTLKVLQNSLTRPDAGHKTSGNEVTKPPTPAKRLSLEHRSLQSVAELPEQVDAYYSPAITTIGQVAPNVEYVHQRTVSVNDSVGYTYQISNN